MMTNLLTTKDELFDRDVRMMPIFTLHRTGNISDADADKLLSKLRKAIALPKIGIIIGSVGLALTILIFGIITWRHKCKGTKQQSLL
jgi:hypothetical protein